jgi:hypothetical protein
MPCIGLIFSNLLLMEFSPDYIIEDLLKADFAAFESAALETFSFQYRENEVYQAFCDALGRTPGFVTDLHHIPFLPIQFFKTKQVVSTHFKPELLFESSGTTGSINSRHYVKYRSVYEQSFMEGFNFFYGDVSDYCIIGLLPSYLERKHSSLVHMVTELVKRSNHPRSGFYLYEYDDLKKILEQNEQAQQKTLLIGVTYALLDFAEKHPMNLNHTIIMETGGMKGRREELTREQVHQILKQQLGLHEVHSEYGMTELLSQAYSTTDGIFNCPPWMQVLVRSEDDPFELTFPRAIDKPVSGAVNIIDLANIYSCSFIATDDVGEVFEDGSFKVYGRMDNSDVRGCSLMVV